MKKKRLTSMRLSQKSKTMLAGLAQHFHQSQTAIIENLIQEKTVILHDRLAPLLPDTVPLRTYVHRFTDSNFLHIPAIEHGFRTTKLFITAMNRHDIPIFDAQIHLDPRTYLVKVDFLRGEFVPDAPRAERIAFFLMPPQTGTIVITGPVT